jgi:polyisoprenoid-binding protein YceI
MLLHTFVSTKNKNTMKRNAIFLLAALAAAPAVGTAQAKWNVDKSHSQVQFTVSHLMISEVTGSFKLFDATVISSKPDFSDAQVTFTIDVNSINTEDVSRDNHLKGDDFFNSEKFPKMTYKGKSIRKTGDKQYEYTGDLTVRDITKPVKLKVLYLGTVKDPWGNTKAGFKITGIVNRFDYNLKWNTLTEAGGTVVGEDVAFTVNLELAQAK